MRTTKILVNALVTGKLDFMNGLLYGLPDCLLNKLQRVHNVAAKIIKCAPRSASTTQLLIDLHWLPIKYRIIFKIVLTVFKALKSHEPRYIYDMLEEYKSSHAGLRSEGKLLLRVPTSRTKTNGDRCFPFAGLYLWNKLPLDVRASESVAVFKKRLKAHYFFLAYGQ